MRCRLLNILVLLAAAAAAFSSSPAEGAPRGPAFGATRYLSEISKETDADEFVSPLVAGETLSVAVAAARGSELRPTITVLGPDGADRTPPLVPVRGGASVSFRRLTVDRTGPWVVRVAGSAASTGAYAATFRVKARPAVKLRAQVLGHGAPLERAHSFDAVEGARLTATVTLPKGGGAAASLSAVESPDGAPLAFLGGRRRGRATTWTLDALRGGDGTYAAVVGIAEGRAAYDLTLRVDVPSRPRGTIALSPLEPKLQAVGAPLRGAALQVVQLRGANFSMGDPPEVWFGGARGAVLRVSIGGSALDVVPPRQPDGTVVPVAVVNPDGQAVEIADYFEYAVPEAPVLSRIEPGLATVYVGGRLRYTVTLSRPAGLSGATVTIAAPGGVGSVPSAVTIPATSRSASFELFAAQTPATGQVQASWGDVTLFAELTVVPLAGGGGGGDPPLLPDEIDVGGWTLVQASSARTFTIPAGTRLRQGGYVVVGRAATQAQFEAYWGVTLGPGVHYFTNDPVNTSASGDDWPSINGGESYSLRDAGGATVDGPTAAMGAAAGEDWQRAAGVGPAEMASSWAVSTEIAPGAAPTPGSGQGTSEVPHGVYVSEFCDAAGAGNYVHEFVELHFDGLVK